MVFRGGGQARALFHQRQLDFFQRHDLVGDGVELFEDFHGAFGIAAADDEFLAAAENRHVEGGGNLAQVFIERSAQMRQARVVERLGDEVVRLYRGFGFQLALFNAGALATNSPRRV
ncbi:hypothetical protein D3C81_669460 [compost metagenome]